MLSIISTSLSGLYAAADQATRAADRITSAGVKAGDALEAAAVAAGNQSYTAVNNMVNGGPAGARALTPQFLPTFNEPSPDEDIVRGFAELIVAENTYQANIAMLKTADQMLGSLIDNKN